MSESGHDDSVDAIARAIVESLAETDYGAILAARGISTVALDQDGNMVFYEPGDKSGRTTKN